MSKPIDIVITVTDRATKPLDRVQKGVKGVGNAAKSGKDNLWQFNKYLFSTAALLGVASKAFHTLFTGIEESAGNERIIDQFQRSVGSIDQFTRKIRETTDTGIDRFTALQAAISIKALGISSSLDDMAVMLAKAGTAAKLAGKDSGEGIKEYADFLKDGSVAHLEFLNLIPRTNAGLQTELSILKHYGGILGDVLTTQEKLALGRKLLDKATQGQLKGNRDLADSVKDLQSNFSYFKTFLGSFIGTSLQPIIERFSNFFDSLTSGTNVLIWHDKNLQFLAKTIVTVTTVLGTALVAFLALKNIMKSLTFLGFGGPGLLLGMISLATAFLGITQGAEKGGSALESFINRLKVFGAFFKGIYELVTSFFDPENFQKGIGKMSDATYKLLKDNGLLGFVTLLSRISIVVITVAKDIVDSFKWAATSLDELFGGLFHKILTGFNKFKDTWKRWWVDDNVSGIQRFLRTIITLGGIGGILFGGSKLLPMLSKIPVIGKLFGGGNPKGTKSDPIYVKSADVLGGLGGGTGFAAAGFFRLLLSEIGLSLAGLLTSLIVGGLSAYFAHKFLNDLDESSNRKKTSGSDTLNWIQAMTHPISSILAKTVLNRIAPGTRSSTASVPIAPTGPTTGSERLSKLNEELSAIDQDKQVSMATAIMSALKTDKDGKQGVDLRDFITIANQYFPFMKQTADSTRKLANKPDNLNVRQ